jgi:hypothetical protein
MGTGDFVEAEADIKKGLGSEPDNADLQALHKKLKVRVAIVDVYESWVCAGNIHLATPTL